MSVINNVPGVDMKSPSELSLSLARQWHQAKVRRERLLEPGRWPLSVSIGKPSARTFAERVEEVQQHVEAWRQPLAGKVEWAFVSYRAGLEPVSLPMRWVLQTPSEWVAATGDCEVGYEYAQLEYLVERVDAAFHPLLVTQRSLWVKKPADEVVETARLAAELSPGCAKGRPLRLLAEHGVDTKFFERNAALLTKLLDERFEGEVSEQGLTTFLDAFDDSSHWVLVAALSPGMLPFKRLRVTTRELLETSLPCSRLLVVENEQCIHLLPELPGTIAILGAGLDLQWLASPHLVGKPIGYWGDMDTWGLLMLARARAHQPHLAALLMKRELFDHYAPGSAVIEPITAQSSVPLGLDHEEAAFYQHLLSRDRGRLEQEYLPQHEVREALVTWSMGMTGIGSVRE
ncbi:Wadjet anti-phage system protein JetD domain-containing protein [Pseudomonas tohonis]|uniref:Wadjet anti-phage system protein JetD domain-containing protein n=1 Tax=Pseudomonas tohonis TaxID=2725477 RepID=UPI0021DA65C7|nr:Wadjet anti-phage system protein JetD domain-containing protein [Pseudomonas tohonis]UXY54895.1 DUF2220 family protein [Pseudomonas tohonis]